jgi:hypothetical protein
MTKIISKYWNIGNILFAVVSVFLVGCSGKIYQKPGVSAAQFKVDLARCEMDATLIPPQQPPPSSSYNIYTTCGPYSCNSTVTPQANPGAIATSLGNALARKQYIENCLLAKGWEEYDQENEFQKSQNIKTEIIDSHGFRRAHYVWSAKITAKSTPLLSNFRADNRIVSELKFGYIVQVLSTGPANGNDVDQWAYVVDDDANMGFVRLLHISRID